MDCSHKLFPVHVSLYQRRTEAVMEDSRLLLRLANRCRSRVLQAAGLIVECSELWILWRLEVIERSDGGLL
jgi:uncharacterized membrane protein